MCRTYPPEQSGRRKRDHISQWWVAWEVQSGEYTHTDYDFKKPSLDLGANVNDPRGHGHAKGEMRDYPGAYTTHDAGGSLARIRLDELRSRYQVVHGIGNARGLAVGALFTLSGFPRDDQNREYLITSATYEAGSNEYATGGEDDPSFDCSFTGMSSAEQFRPPCVTPKPVVQGPQTARGRRPRRRGDPHRRARPHQGAVPLGPRGQEGPGQLVLDARRRSCGRAAAGARCSIPRIGMEVIVDFLEGDPDQPIVTGCVYNGSNKPPYALPGEKTQIDHQEQFEQGRRRLERDALRGQEGQRRDLYPRAEGSQPRHRA